MEWEVHEKYIFEKLKEIEEGKVIELKVMDRENFLKSVVRCIVSKERMDGADPLWIIHDTEVGEKFLPDPWWIKIVD